MVSKRAIVQFLFMLAMFSIGAVGLVHAENAEAEIEAPVDAEVAPKESPATDTKNRSKASNGTSNKTTKDKTFVPSEEISEDFAVSFPADI